MANNEMFDFLSSHITKSDLYSANVMAKISALIINKRSEMHMTQKAFAEMMGVTQGMVSKWESSEYNFTVESIAQIAEKLRVSVDIEFKAENEYLKNHNSYNCNGVRLSEWAQKGQGVIYAA